MAPTSERGSRGVYIYTEFLASVNSTTIFRSNSLQKLNHISTMAPLLNLLITLLPGLPNKLIPSVNSPAGIDQLSLLKPDYHQQHLADAKYSGKSEAHANTAKPSAISTVSWGKDRLDIFALVENNLTHKYWAGDQWVPSGTELETLGNGLATEPVAITWGTDRLDIFGLDDHNVVKHQYWEGKNWQPSPGEFENLGGGCDAPYPKPVAASSWGEGRLDVFCTGPNGDLLHQYYDGSQWQPSTGALESLGGSLASSPSVVSWGENRLDIFGVDNSGNLAHLYWDGHQWSAWETFSFPSQFGIRGNGLTVTSWGKNRLDIYVVAFDGRLYHIFYDGYQWSPFENFGGDKLLGAAAATSWSENRIDIVVRGGAGKNYWYKYWDGQAWRPDAAGWYNKGEGYKFGSDPNVASWGENRLDIVGLDDAGKLLHQTWYGSGWYPDSAEWEVLG